MLLKTADGQVYNLDHAYKLHVGRPTSATLTRLGSGRMQGLSKRGTELFVVQAYFANEEIDLTDPVSREDAQTILDRIFREHPNNVDLSGGS